MESMKEEPKYESLWALKELPSLLWQIPTPLGIAIVPLLRGKEAQPQAELMFLEFRENMPLRRLLCSLPPAGIGSQQKTL